MAWGRVPDGSLGAKERRSKRSLKSFCVVAAAAAKDVPLRLRSEVLQCNSALERKPYIGFPS